MTISLASFIAIYDRALVTCAHLLEKGSAFAAENGVAEADFLNWRLVEDMHPLSFQAAVVVNFSRSYMARAAGQALPDNVIGADLDLAGLQAAIVDARAYLAAIPAESLAGRDDVMEQVQITDTMQPTLPIGQWISNFALTNIEFHTSMAYAILRLKGVPLGKIDMFPAGL
jgi:hypothetical protein